MEERLYDLIFIARPATQEDEIKKVLEKENITWRSWWDGGSTQGPIAKKWNVHGWPTIYVLDGKGVIRAKLAEEGYAKRHTTKELIKAANEIAK